MDLRIKNNNATKSYVITNNCTTRPRVCMKSDTGVPATPISYLPLTTSTTQGLALRAKVNDQSYRALEFRSMSGSATFYSSNANGQGLSSTTALTCSSTSRTEYLTQSSTSRTEYLTRSSTSATSYLTRSSTSGESYLTKYGSDITVRNEAHVSDMYNYQGSHYMTRDETMTGIYKSSYDRTYTAWDGTRTYTCTCVFGTYTQLAGNYWWYMTHRIPSDMSYGCATRYIYQSDNSYYTSTFSNSYSSLITQFLRSPSDNFTYAIATSTNTTYPNMLLTSWSQSTLSWGDNGGYTRYSSTYTQGYVILTTGTSYLTRSSTSSTVYYTRSSTYDTVYYTRSSTYSTVYHTRSSTSGYSGVSSSSSETSGWQ